MRVHIAKARHTRFDQALSLSMAQSVASNETIGGRDSVWEQCSDTRWQAAGRQ